MPPRRSPPGADWYTSLSVDEAQEVAMLEEVIEGCDRARTAAALRRSTIQRRATVRAHLRRKKERRE